MENHLCCGPMCPLCAMIGHNAPRVPQPTAGSGETSNYPPLKPGTVICVFCGNHPSNHTVSCTNPLRQKTV